MATVTGTIKANSGDTQIVAGLDVTRVEVRDSPSRVTVFRDGTGSNPVSFADWAQGEGRGLAFYFICGTDGTVEYLVDDATTAAASIRWGAAASCMFLSTGEEMRMVIATPGGLGSRSVRRPIHTDTNPNPP